MDDFLRAKLDGAQRLMEQASTEGEAQAAAAAFQRLVTRFQLQAEDLQNLGTTAKAKYVCQSVRLGEKRETGIYWRSQLLATLAHFNWCQVVLHSDTQAIVDIVGTQESIDLVGRIFISLRVTFERMAPTRFEEKLAEWRSQYPQFARRSLSEQYEWGRPHRVKWCNAFLIGAWRGIAQRMAEERRQEKTEDPKVGALVVVKGAELVKATDDLMGKLRQVRRTHNTFDGYRDGYKAGYEHRENTPLSSTTSRALGSGGF